MARFLINLEPPTSDEEFLSSCVEIGDVFRSIADEVEEWAEGVAALGLPSSVTSPLHQIPEAIVEAAQSATQAAARFEDEFEEPREIASRGMKFTGRDAA